MSPQGNAHFNPDVARQSTCWMSQALSASLLDIQHQLQSHQNMASCSTAVTELHNNVVKALSKKHSLSPLLFAGYYHFVHLLEQGDVEYCTRLLQELPCEMAGQTIVNGTLELCTTDIHRSLLNNCLYTETQESYWEHCETQEFQQAYAKISDVINIIKRTQTNFHQEFQTLVSTIVMAKPKSQTFRFDGASSYHLWGLMMLAWDDQKTDLEWIETLAHESSHIYLFGLIRDQALLVEDNEGLYSSPLRADKRPLEGIYHATYVSARMYLAVIHYRHSHPSYFDQAEVNHLTSASLAAFRDGHQTIMRHAQLTELGRSILDDCVRAIEA